MAQTGRAVGAVVVGAMVWAALWIGGNRVTQLAFPGIADPTQPLRHLGLLVGYIGYSVILSILAGWVTGVVRGRDPMTAVWVLAVLQLGLGIVAEVANWALLPVWYHLVFLALLVPSTLWGGLIARNRGQVTTS